jgi:hypothetical protein
MNMAPASVVGVVYVGAAGTTVVGLITGTDRGDRGRIGDDMYQRHPSSTGFLGGNRSPHRSRLDFLGRGQE